MSYYIGIDLGTSSVKLVLTDETGKVKWEEERSYELLQPAPGWKEIDPATWWERFEDAFGELLLHVNREEIVGIGVTGQMHTLVLIDENGEVIRPALMWNDTRTADLIDGIKEKLKETESEYINRIISTGSPAANMLWVKKNEPENYRRIRKFLIGPDYIVYRLTNVTGTDFCEASTSSMYDVEKRAWSKVMQQLLELDDEVYPEVRGSAEIVGTLSEEMAAKFDLPKSIKVIVGTGDNPAASIPTGCLGNNYPVFSMGTSGVLIFPRNTVDLYAKGKNILFSFDRKIFDVLVQGVIQSCGSSFSWWHNSILDNDEFQKAEAAIDMDKLGESPVLFYPHLVGDKTIYADPSLRGAFIGLGTETMVADMTQAVMEGIAFALRELIQEMHLSKEQLNELKVIGGGSKSRVWMQIIADVLNLPIAQLGGNASAGYGMALLAAYSCGDISSLEEISDKAVKVKEHFYPRAHNAKLYDDKYERYLKIHGALKSVM